MPQLLYYSVIERESTLHLVNDSFNALYEEAKEDFLNYIEQYYEKGSDEYIELMNHFEDADEHRQTSPSISYDGLSTDGDRGMHINFENEYLNFWSNDNGDNFDMYVERLPKSM